MLVLLFCHQTATGRESGLLLSEALMIVLAHYFAARRVVTLPPDILQQLEERGALVAEANPLWLPQGSIRGTILLAFFLLALLLASEGRLLDPATLGSVGLIFAFLSGVTVRWFRRNRSPSPRGAFWIHLKAFLVVAIGILVVATTLSGMEIPGPAENLLLAFVLFYFGSR